MGHVRQFSKDALIYGLGGGIKKFIALFLVPIYVRVLSPEDYGALDTLTSGVLFFSSFLNLGLSTASTRFFFKAKTEEQQGQILFATLVIRLLSFLPVLPLFFFQGYIQNVFFQGDLHGMAVLIALLIIPAQLLSNEQENIYRIKRKPYSFLIFSLSKALLGVAGGIILVVYLKQGISGALASSLLSSLIVITFSFSFFSRRQYCYRFSAFWAKKIFLYGLPAISVGLASWVLALSDRFILLMYYDYSSVGIYSIANKFSEPLRILNTAVQMSFGPLIVSMFENDHSQDYFLTRNTADRIWKVYLFLSVGFAMMVSVFSPELIRLITTIDYLPGASSVPWLTFSFVFVQSATFVGYRLNLKEKRHHYFYLMAISAVLNVILNFVLIPSFGIKGAAIATLTAYFFNFILSWHIAGRHFGPPQEIKVNLLGIFICFVISLFLQTTALWIKIPVMIIIISFIGYYLNKKGIFDKIKSFIFKF